MSRANEHLKLSSDSDLDPVEFRAAVDITAAFLVVVKSYGLFPPEHRSTQKMLGSFSSQLNKFINTYGSLRLEIEKTRLLYFDEIVFEEEGSDDNPAFLFFRDGIRWLEFEEGLREEEVVRFLQIVNFCKDTYATEEQDGDIVTALWSADFEHIRYEASDELWEAEPVLEFSLLNPEAQEFLERGGGYAKAMGFDMLKSVLGIEHESLLREGEDDESQTAKDRSRGGETGGTGEASGDGAGFGERSGLTTGPFEEDDGGSGEVTGDGTAGAEGSPDDLDFWNKLTEAEESAGGSVGTAEDLESGPGADGGFGEGEGGDTGSGPGEGDGEGSVAGGIGAGSGSGKGEGSGFGSGPGEGTGDGSVAGVVGAGSGSGIGAGVGSGSGTEEGDGGGSGGKGLGVGLGAGDGPGSASGRGVGRALSPDVPGGEGSGAGAGPGKGPGKGSGMEPGGGAAAVAPTGSGMEQGGSGSGAKKGPRGKHGNRRSSALPKLGRGIGQQARGAKAGEGQGTDSHATAVDQKKAGVDSRPGQGGDWESIRPSDDTFISVSVASIGVGETLWNFSLEEKRTLDQMIKDHEEQSASSDVTELLMFVLRDETEPHIFGSIINFMKEESRNILKVQDFRLAYTLLNNLKEMRDYLKEDKTWALPILDKYFDDIAEPEIMDSLMPVWSELQTFDDAKLKTFAALMQLLPPKTGESLAPMYSRVKSSQGRRIMVDMIAAFLRRDLKILEKMLTRPEEEITLRLVNVIKGLQDHNIAEVLIFKVIHHPNDKVRKEALSMLVMRESQQFEKMFQMINDPNPDIRYHLLDYLGDKRRPIAESVLRIYMESDRFQRRDPEHILACYRALGRCGSDSSVSFLQNILFNQPWNFVVGYGTPLHRQGAALALKLIKTPGSIKIFNRASKSAIPHIKGAWQKADANKRK